MQRNFLLICLFSWAIPAFGGPMVIDGEVISDDPSEAHQFLQTHNVPKNKQEPASARAMTEFEAKSIINDKIKEAISQAQSSMLGEQDLVIDGLPQIQLANNHCTAKVPTSYHDPFTGAVLKRQNLIYEFAVDLPSRVILQTDFRSQLVIPPSAPQPQTQEFSYPNYSNHQNSAGSSYMSRYSHSTFHP
jgi:hypothetical protein